MAGDEQRSSISVPAPMSSPRSQRSGAIRFGVYEVDLRNSMLRKHGLKIRLPYQSFQILSALLSRPGELVGRDELRILLWPHDVHVDFDRSLNTAVQKLRSALHDSSRKPRYIETLPRQGYRFVAEINGAVSSTSSPISDVLPTSAIGEPAPSMEVPSDSNLHSVENRSLGQYSWRFFSLAVLGLFVLVTVGWYVRHSPKASLHISDTAPGAQIQLSRGSVAVLGFKNSSRSAQASWISTALSEMLATEMTAGGQLRSLPEEAVARAKLELTLSNQDSYTSDTLAKIHKNLGCDYVVVGSYVALGRPQEGKVRLDARVQDATNAQIVGSVAVLGSQSNLFELVSEAGQQLRAQLGVGMPTGSDIEEIRAVLPSGSEAARLYSEALNDLRAFNALAARDLFEEVTRLQPQYAPAYSGLARAWSALGYDTNAIAAAKKATELSAHMPKRVRQEAEARYYELNGNWEPAASTYSQLQQSYPNTLEYGLSLAEMQSNLEHNTDALNTIAALRKLSWSEGEFAIIDLAQATIAGVMSDLKGEKDLAQQSAEKANRSGAALLKARAKLIEGFASNMLSQNTEADEAFATAKRIFSSYGDLDQSAVAVMNQGFLAYRQGNLALAEKLLTSTEKVFQQVGDQANLTRVLANIANIYSDHGDLPAAERLNRRCLNIFSQTGHQSNQDGVAYNLAETLQEEGKLQEAEQVLLPTVEHLRNAKQKGLLGYTLGLLGVIKEARGDMMAALQLMDEAISLLNETGDKLSAADTEQYLAIFQLRHGDPAQAKRTLAHAMSIDHEAGAKSQIDFDNVIMAELALEQGQPADAALLRDVIRGLRQEHVANPEIEAEIALSRELLREGQILDAERMAAHANLLASKSYDPTIKIQSALVTARVAMAEQRVGSAERVLREALGQAKKAGCIRCELQVQLELGKLECHRGHVEQGRRQLRDVAAEAQHRGYGWIATRSLSESQDGLASANASPL